MNGSWQEPPEYRDGGGVSLAVPRLSPLIKKLMLINGGLFLASYIFSLAAPEAWLTVTKWFAVSPDLWKSWAPFVPVWQLVTYGFLHSVTSPMHVLMNMLFLYFLGTMLEGIIGSKRFLSTYLAAIAVAGACTLATGLIMGDDRWVVGASGGVMAIVVACAVLRPDTRIIFIIIPMTLKVFAWIYVGLDVFHSINVVFGGQRAGVAYFAHLGGAAFGYLAVKKGWIWRDPIQELETRKQKRQEQQREDDAQKLDDLLARIHRDGIHSLSEREKAFLKKASQRR